MKYIRHFDNHAEHEQELQNLENLGLYLSYCEEDLESKLWRKYKKQLPNPYFGNPYVKQYLTIETLVPNVDILINIPRSVSNNYFTEIQVSTDGENWDMLQFPYDGGPAQRLGFSIREIGSKLYIKGQAREDEFNLSAAQCLNINISSGNCKVYGNIMSLVYGDDFADKTLFKTENFKGFYRLFYQSSDIVDAENLLLPAMKLTPSCYSNMFFGCSKLSKCPELPATDIATGCYSFMFKGCSNLVSPPILPAMKLEKSCYTNMFDSCTSLTTAPELPATDIATGCYTNMFIGCSKITTAPELPAPILVDYCYSSMFSNCTKLSYVKMLAVEINGTQTFMSWLSNVSSSGTLVLNSESTISLPNGTSGIPEGWTVETVTV